MLLICSFLFIPVSFAEWQVIVHPSNTSELSSNDIKRIFLGKKKKFANGDLAIPLALDNGSTTSSEFKKTILKKSSAQYKSYWARRIFTGRGSPPKTIASQDMIKRVSENPQYIGYIDVEWIDASVRAIEIK